MVKREDKPLDPLKVLTGEQDPPTPPGKTHQTDMRFTPNGTGFSNRPTPEYQQYIRDWDKYSERMRAEAAKLANVPAPKPLAKGQERVFSRGDGKGRGKIPEQEKDNDLEL